MSRGKKSNNFCKKGRNGFRKIPTDRHELAGSGAAARKKKKKKNRGTKCLSQRSVVGYGGKRRRLPPIRDLFEWGFEFGGEGF